MDQGSKRSLARPAMYLLILVSLVLIGTIGYIITLQSISTVAISTITSVLITVTGILLGLSGLLPSAKSLDRIKLQVSYTIVTILWLALVIVIAQREATIFAFYASDLLRYLFLVGLGLFTILVVIYSTATVEATRQRLVAEQVARETAKGKIC